MLSADTNYELFLTPCSLSRPDELQEGKSRDSFVPVGPPSRKAEDFLFNARAGSRQGNRALQVIAPPQVKRFVLRVTRQPDRTSEGKTCGESPYGGAALLLVGCSLTLFLPSLLKVANSKRGRRTDHHRPTTSRPPARYVTYAVGPRSPGSKFHF